MEAAIASGDELGEEDKDGAKFRRPIAAALEHGAHGCEAAELDAGSGKKSVEQPQPVRNQRQPDGGAQQGLGRGATT